MPESGQPGMCSAIATDIEVMGMEQVADMVKEIQPTSRTNTTVRR
ncbi:MAG: hypothetical protein ACU841_16950 [Gammaproteobacteria bacterium]